jgi:lincosamide nucleotidyltransferase A/C/D/E
VERRKHVTGWLTRIALSVSGGPLGRLRRSGISQRLKRSVFEVPADAIAGVVDALERGGVRSVVAGGWGVDALLGEQTRKHLDLDLVFDAVEEPKAVAALERAGFELVRREDLDPPADAPLRLEARVVMANASGLLVDLHPAVLAPGARPDELYAVGIIDGKEVRCLSVRGQLALHRDYDPRDFDRQDVARLEERFGGADGGPRAAAR